MSFREMSVINDLQTALTYDPVRGFLSWRHDRRPRVKAGDEAGMVHKKTHRVLVTFKGVRYEAARVIWALLHGQWPEGRLIFRDQDPQNLKLTNIMLEPLSDSPHATYQRARNAHRRKGRRIAQMVEARQLSQLPFEQQISIKQPFQRGDGRWSAGLTYNLHNFVEIVPQPTEEQARHMLGWLINGAHYAEAHPAPETAPPEWRGRFLGDDPKHGFSLFMVHQRLAYDPALGQLYWRRWQDPTARSGWRGALGKTATDLTRHGPLGYTVPLAGRPWPAHNIGWFLYTGEWPEHGAIGFANGDRTDLRFSNLVNRKHRP